MTTFINKDFHVGLKNLAQYDWLRIEGRAAVGDWTQCAVAVKRPSVERAILATPVGKDRDALNRLMAACVGEGLHIVACEAISRLLADGPKVFCPSMQQCEAMENVAINLSVADYQQAYPALVVEFPQEYVDTRHTYARILVRHDASQQRLFCFAGTLVHGGVYDSQTIVNPEETIESCLNRQIDHVPHIPMTTENRTFTTAVRVALNCNLALTHYTTRLRAANPDLLRQIKQRCHDENRERRHTARRRLLGQFQVIEFDQEVIFHEDESEPQILSVKRLETSKWTVRPHWRRGYWRRQPFGARRSERKLIFVKPTLVRRDIFAGDCANTEVVYRGVSPVRC